jgi:acetyltransferase
MREVADHSDQTLIASYPEKYVSTRELRDGTKVLLRPIMAEDEDRFNELFMSLSPESMRFRFFEMMKELSHDALTRYCNLDYDREIAFVAELQTARQVIGAGGVILEPNGKVGEFAVLVRDPWQSRGLGSMFMDHIISVARDMRLEMLFAYVLSNNYKMLNLCKKKGFMLETLDEETVKASLSF